MTIKRSIPFAIGLVLLGACSKPKPEVPSLTPEQASTILEFDTKAKNWLTVVKRTNTACEYKLDLPDQSNHPAEIDLDHIMSCNGKPSPKEFDATAIFIFDAAQGRWTLQRFSS